MRFTSYITTFGSHTVDQPYTAKDMFKAAKMIATSSIFGLHNAVIESVYDEDYNVIGYNVTCTNYHNGLVLNGRMIAVEVR